MTRHHTLRRHFRRSTVAIAMALSLWPVATPAQPSLTSEGDTASRALPNLGDGAEMSPAAERKLGDRIIRELYRDPDYLDDPVVLEYVQGIWKPLLAAARLRGELPSELDDSYAWEILLGRDRSVNAFALPGGYLGLHLGLVAVTANRDELASVLAHELSHVTQRHIARNMARANAQTPWVMGAMILGLLAASKSPGAAQALIVGGQGAAMQTQLNFTRDMEREADRVGFGVLSQAGFAPSGFTGMFEKLQQANRLNDSGAFPYLRSHPLTTERIADMQGRLPQGQAAQAPANATEHALIAARARVLSNGSVDALRQFMEQAQVPQLAGKSEPAHVGTLYAAAFAAMKARDYGQAQALLSRLTPRLQGQPVAIRWVRLLAAELALAQGQGQTALDAIRGLETGSRAATMLQAQALLQEQRASDAATLVQGWLADHKVDALAWQMLARALATQGRTVAAVRAEAEANIAQLDFTTAQTRLQAAQDLSRKGSAGVDHIEASIVDTRLRQVESILREQALER